MEPLEEMPSQEKGDYTEAVVISELKRRGISVSVPFGDNERYDLVVGSTDGLFTLQVKTGWLRDGVIHFNGTSQHTNSTGNTYKRYQNDVDYFLVFCHELESMYLVAEEAFDTSMWLRVAEPKQPQRTINWAEEYEFARNWPPEPTNSGADDDERRVLRSLRERGVSVFDSTDQEQPYDVILATDDDRLFRTNVVPGYVIYGRIRFDTKEGLVPGPEETDLVLVHCEELDGLYLVRRDEYDATISFRVDPPEQHDSKINRADEYEFDERWPPAPR